MSLNFKFSNLRYLHVSSCTHTHTHTQWHMHACTHTHTHMHEHLHTHTHTHTHVHAHTHMHVHTHICMHAHTGVGGGMYVCVCVCIRVQSYLFVWLFCFPLHIISPMTAPIIEMYNMNSCWCSVQIYIWACDKRYSRLTPVCLYTPIYFRLTTVTRNCGCFYSVCIDE